MALSLLTQIAAIYVPVLQAAFHTVSLTGADWLLATAVAGALLVIMELAKLVIRKRALAPAAGAHRMQEAPPRS